MAVYFNCQRAVEEDGGKKCIKILERDIITMERNIYKAKEEL